MMEENRVNGILFPAVCSKEAILSSLSYKPRPGQLILVGYPRSGNTWMKYIVTSILRKGQVFEDPVDFFIGCPNLEWSGRDCLDYIPQDGAIRSHLPFNTIPYSSDAKYIYINRNPRDCCVSYYHLHKTIPIINGKENSSFDEFFEDFLQGNVPYGDYFDHVLEWYQHRNDSNVHFVMYENLKKDFSGEILKIAKFIGNEYERCILEDENVMKNILYYSSFEYMKKHANQCMDTYFRGDKIFEIKDLPSGLKTYFQNVIAAKQNHKPIKDFVRKGIIGDWKNYFTEDQLKRLEAKIEEKTAGSDIKMLWLDAFNTVENNFYHA